jgi:hypothetical protein
LPGRTIGQLFQPGGYLFISEEIVFLDSSSILLHMILEEINNVNNGLGTAIIQDVMSKSIQRQEMGIEKLFVEILNGQAEQRLTKVQGLAD